MPEKKKPELCGAVRINKRTVRARDAALDDNDFWCYVTNKTDYTITHVVFVGGADDGREAPISPPIERTAPDQLSCEDAHAQGKYEPFMYKLCTDAAAQWKLKAALGSEVAYTDPFTISPDCDHTGVVVCLES